MHRREREGVELRPTRVRHTLPSPRSSEMAREANGCQGGIDGAAPEEEEAKRTREEVSDGERKRRRTGVSETDPEEASKFIPCATLVPSPIPPHKENSPRDAATLVIHVFSSECSHWS